MFLHWLNYCVYGRFLRQEQGRLIKVHTCCILAPQFPFVLLPSCLICKVFSTSLNSEKSARIVTRLKKLKRQQPPTSEVLLESLHNQGLLLYLVVPCETTRWWDWCCTPSFTWIRIWWFVWYLLTNILVLLIAIVVRKSFRLSIVSEFDCDCLTRFSCIQRLYVTRPTDVNFVQRW